MRRISPRIMTTTTIHPITHRLGLVGVFDSHHPLSEFRKYSLDPHQSLEEDLLLLPLWQLHQLYRESRLRRTRPISHHKIRSWKDPVRYQAPAHIYLPYLSSRSPRTLASHLRCLHCQQLHHPRYSIQCRYRTHCHSTHPLQPHPHHSVRLAPLMESPSIYT